MSYHIFITQTAERDLNESMDYIEFVLKNPEAADHLLDLVTEKIKCLSHNPRIHPIVEDSVLHSWGIRFVTVNNYIVFYHVNEEASCINIIRFLYGKRDWISILKQGIRLE